MQTNSKPGTLQEMIERLRLEWAFDDGPGGRDIRALCDTLELHDVNFQTEMGNRSASESYAGCLWDAEVVLGKLWEE